MQKIAFLGGGNMANALINGLVTSGCKKQDIHIIDINDITINQWQSKGFSTSSTADTQLSTCDIWVLSVKPQFLHDALVQCLPFIKENTLVISIAAGIAAQTISQWLSHNGEPHAKLVRCMPNTPALIGAGITGAFPLNAVTEQDKLTINQILQAVGEVVWVKSDDEIDAITAISGSGPAYVFLFINSLVNAAIELGLNHDQAKQLAMSTVLGATKLALSSDESLTILKEKVTSKGGTTAAALNVLENDDALQVLIRQASKSAYKRAVELSKQLEN